MSAQSQHFKLLARVVVAGSQWECCRRSLLGYALLGYALQYGGSDFETVLLENQCFKCFKAGEKEQRSLILCPLCWCSYLKAWSKVGAMGIVLRLPPSLVEKIIFSINHFPTSCATNLMLHVLPFYQAISHYPSPQLHSPGMEVSLCPQHSQVIKKHQKQKGRFTLLHQLQFTIGTFRYLEMQNANAEIHKDQTFPSAKLLLFEHEWGL